MSKKTALAVPGKSSPASFGQAAKLAGEIDISDFRLLGCKCAQDFVRIAKEKSLPNAVTQTVQLASQRGKIEKSARFLVKYVFGARYPDEKEKVPATIQIEAQFTIKYTRRTGRFSEKEIDTVGHVVAALNSWPYWREFVQSMTGRMGLPPLQIPLLNVTDLVEVDDNSKD